MKGKKEYRKYLKGDHWKDFKKRFKESEYYTSQCYMCSCGGPFHLHHRSYKRLGFESFTDVILLCPGCHNKLHKYLKKHKKQSLWDVADFLKKKKGKKRLPKKLKGKKKQKKCKKKVVKEKTKLKKISPLEKKNLFRKEKEKKNTNLVEKALIFMKDKEIERG